MLLSGTALVVRYPNDPQLPWSLCDVSVGIRVPLLQTKHALGFSSIQQIQEGFPRHNFFKWPFLVFLNPLRLKLLSSLVPNWLRLSTCRMQLYTDNQVLAMVVRASSPRTHPDHWYCGLFLAISQVRNLSHRDQKPCFEPIVIRFAVTPPRESKKSHQMPRGIDIPFHCARLTQHRIELSPISRTVCCRTARSRNA